MCNIFWNNICRKAHCFVCYLVRKELFRESNIPISQVTVTLSRRSDPRRFHLSVPDLKINCRDLTALQARRHGGIMTVALHWRHNDYDGVSNHQPHAWLFTQSFIQAQIKENITAPRHWPLCGEFTGTGEFPAQKASKRGKCFHLMTSSWSDTSHARFQAAYRLEFSLSSEKDHLTSCPSVPTHQKAGVFFTSSPAWQNRISKDYLCYLPQMVSIAKFNILAEHICFSTNRIWTTK